MASIGVLFVTQVPYWSGRLPKPALDQNLKPWSQPKFNKYTSIHTYPARTIAHQLQYRYHLNWSKYDKGKDINIGACTWYPCLPNPVQPEYTGHIT